MSPARDLTGRKAAKAAAEFVAEDVALPRRQQMSVRAAGCDFKWKRTGFAKRLLDRRFTGWRAGRNPAGSKALHLAKVTSAM